MVKSRARLVWHGAAVATVVVDEDGDLVAEPKLALPGLVGDEQASGLIGEALSAIRKVIGDLPRPIRRDNAALSEAVRVAIRRSIVQARGKKPSIEVHLVRI